MRSQKKKLLCLLFFCCYASSAFSKSYFGGTIAYVLEGSEPPNLHGYQFLVNYDPERFQWRQFNILFDAGVSRFWITNTIPRSHTNINAYSIAPIIRYTFKKHGPLLPYLDISIGAAYLNRSRIGHRNLGIHYAFQDRIGFGFWLGAKEQLAMGLHTMHYSNAHFSCHNSGITMPIVFDMNYRW